MITGTTMLPKGWSIRSTVRHSGWATVVYWSANWDEVARHAGFLTERFGDSYLISIVEDVD